MNDGQIDRWTALWTPIWYSLDQPLTLGSTDLTFGADDSGALRIFAVDWRDREPVDQPVVVEELIHHTLGIIRSVDTSDLEYVVTLGDGSTIWVDAEEQIGSARREDHTPVLVEDWTIVVSGRYVQPQ
jgi:hypothetical protein